MTDFKQWKKDTKKHSRITFLASVIPWVIIYFTLDLYFLGFLVFLGIQLYSHHRYYPSLQDEKYRKESPLLKKINEVEKILLNERNRTRSKEKILPECNNAPSEEKLAKILPFKRKGA